MFVLVGCQIEAPPKAKIRTCNPLKTKITSGERISSNVVMSKDKIVNKRFALGRPLRKTPFCIVIFDAWEWLPLAGTSTADSVGGSAIAARYTIQEFVASSG